MSGAVAMLRFTRVVVAGLLVGTAACAHRPGHEAMNGLACRDCDVDNGRIFRGTSCILAVFEIWQSSGGEPTRLVVLALNQRFPETACSCGTKAERYLRPTGLLKDPVGTTLTATKWAWREEGRIGQFALAFDDDVVGLVRIERATGEYWALSSDDEVCALAALVPPPAFSVGRFTRRGERE
jgi:hypothetical protein